MKELIELFLTFLKMGALTFGGGYAMMPVLEREIVNKRGWAQMDEVIDYYTIAQVTPGIIAVNVSTFIGYKRKGIPGGIAATLGFVLPGVVLVMLIALCISRFADYPYVRHAFAGIRVAVGALILDTVMKLGKGLFKDRTSAKRFLAPAVFVIVFALSAVVSTSPAALVAAAGLVGFLFYRPRCDKEAL